MLERVWRKIHCWLECKLVLPPWRTVLRLLKKLKIELPYYPAILLLGKYLKKTVMQKHICTSALGASQVAQWYSIPANAEDAGLIPGSGKSPGGGNGNLLQYSCLESPMDRGAWWTIVHSITESDTTEVT